MLALMKGWPAEWRERAQHVVDFFETKLSLQKGDAAGQPFLLSPWQEEVLRLAYGPRHPDGRRICKVIWLEVASKNAKSTLAGGVGLYELLHSGSGGAEVYSVARNRKQARLVFLSGRAMAIDSAPVAERLHIFRHSIEVEGDELAKFEPLVSDEDTIDGVDPQAVIFDEVHRFGHAGAGVVRTLQAKQASRRDPIMMFISTAGEFDTDTIAWELHSYAKGVIDGSNPDPTWVARIFTVPQELDPWDEKHWPLANPNLGVSVSIDFLRDRARAAKKSKAAEAAFRRFHLNQWVAIETKFVDIQLWDACPKGDLRDVLRELAGQPCCSGLDLGSTRDLSAHALLFPRPGETFDVIVRCFMPVERLAEHIENDERPYDVWAREGWLTLTPGNVIDFRAIRLSIEDDFRAFKLRDLAFDRAGAANMTQELDLTLGEQSGLPEQDRLNVIAFGQGFLSMSEPTKDLLDLVRAGRIRHFGNPILRWMMDCCTTVQDPAGNIKPVKPDRRKHKKRIDAVVALIMGLARARLLKAKVEAGAGVSVYEQRGVLVF